MATLAATIKDMLAADPVLTAAQPDGLGFLVWDRWLIKTGPGATPEAFDDARGGRLRRNLVVLDGGEFPHPRGPMGVDGRRWTSAPTIHAFAEPTTAGKAAIDAAWREIDALLRGQQFQIDGGQMVGAVVDARIPITDSDQFPGNVATQFRLQAVGARWY